MLYSFLPVTIWKHCTHKDVSFFVWKCSWTHTHRPSEHKNIDLAFNGSTVSALCSNNAMMMMPLLRTTIILSLWWQYLKTYSILSRFLRTIKIQKGEICARTLFPTHTQSHCISSLMSISHCMSHNVCVAERSAKNPKYRLAQNHNLYCWNGK